MVADGYDQGCGHAQGWGQVMVGSRWIQMPGMKDHSGHLNRTAVREHMLPQSTQKVLWIKIFRRPWLSLSTEKYAVVSNERTFGTDNTIVENDAAVASASLR